MNITEFVLRISIAALLGGIIGIERGFRAKEAGFRTHFLVALGAALFMVLSAHGFDDVELTENMRLDVARIAAQVVSGIGFLGAGTIIFQRHAVHGLTTAAGLWVTAAIGMAAGAGLYLLASFAMVLTLVGLELLNGLFPNIGHHNITLTVSADSRQRVEELLEQIKAEGTMVLTYSCTEDSPHRFVVKMELRPNRGGYADHVLHLLTAQEGVNVDAIE